MSFSHNIDNHEFRVYKDQKNWTIQYSSDDGVHFRECFDRSEYFLTEIEQITASINVVECILSSSNEVSRCVDIINKELKKSYRFISEQLPVISK